MKRFVLVIFIALSLFSLFSETKTIPSVVFTAYKGSYGSDGIPQVMSGDFRIVSSEEETVNSSTRLSISSEYRNKVYDFFSWIANGNAAGTVTLSFEFTPLSFTNSSNITSTIPYTITLTHTTTLVDGVLVAMNRESSNLATLSPRKCTFSDKYFVWADTIKTKAGNGNYASALEVSADVGTSNLKVYFQYNLATGTLTKEKNAQDEWVLVSEGNNPKAYPYSVSDHWTRSGECEIKLKITAEGNSTTNPSSAYAMGLYQAQVTVEMSGP